LADGTYSLRVQVEGTGQSDVTNVDINRVLNPQGNDTTGPFVTATLDERIRNVLAFPERSALLNGIASPGAEGVDLYYSTSGPKESPQWSRCGFVGLPGGAATAPQPYEGYCILPGDDPASQVTGVAAVAWDCSAPSPNCANPNPSPIANTGQNYPPRSSSTGAPGAGEAKRVFGCDTTPCMSLQPFDWQTNTGECQKYVAIIGDEMGKPVSGVNVDVTLSGPGDGAHFCSEVEDASPMRAPERDGEYQDSIQTVTKDPYGPDTHHTEGETNADGRFVFGVLSDQADFQTIFSTTENSYMSINAWLDGDGDDLHSDGEQRDGSSMHWLLPGRCTIVGTEDGDLLVGTVGDDKICGLGGDDTVFAEEGVDVILGGDGNDELWGDEGSDQVAGEAGDDIVYGGPGKDKLNGGEGANSCPDYRASKDGKLKSCDVPAKQPP
jgi:Ca2+-binding RTX toxin-like protein